MKIILFGASGMVGQGVLRECLLDPEVERVLVVGRSELGQAHQKIREVIHENFFDFTPIESELRGYDACIFCLGTSSAGMKEAGLSPNNPRHHARRGSNSGETQSEYDIHLCLGDGHGQQRTRPHDVGARQRENRKRFAAIAVRSSLHVPVRFHSAAARNPVKNELVPDLVCNHRAALPSFAEAFPKVCDDDGRAGASDAASGKERCPEARPGNGRNPSPCGVVS